MGGSAFSQGVEERIGEGRARSADGRGDSGVRPAGAEGSPVEAVATSARSRTGRLSTVPYIASWSQERMRRPPVVRRTGAEGEGIGFPGESAYDRDWRGVLWTRQILARGKGRPQYHTVHTLRQRRAMRHMLCQVCGGPTPEDGPRLFVLRDVGRPVEEGERTTAPPVCVPCARISVRECPRLREGHVAALVGRPYAWGVAGIVHHPVTLEPLDTALQEVSYEDLAVRWTLAHRLIVTLHDCTPVDLDALAA
ncbi:hypothetical protein SAMN05216481_103263 [Streptomyces radiopugnans]|uniref:Uncharacterized protein n=1 Tax=Streptomyces radiopugnans TaxID=403935 RepID=A0A1H9CJ37_9ACTN|nr:hypothetical protein SAMN05216481_103263 [Streptomyces radiopugnans]